MNCYFYTFGCKVNTCETAGMQSLLQSAGYTIAAQPEQADIFLFNSCTVTASGDSRLRHTMRKVRREHPDALLVLTGCYPQAYPNGAQDDFEALPCDTMPDNTRAFLKIQDGCNCFCSYCIIPYARGRCRSMKPDELRKAAAGFAENGYREIVLCGINLGFYGMEWSGSLAEAVELCAAVPGVERVRLGSLEPERLTEEQLSRLTALPQFCPQFHLSLQSGCDKTLRAMNRKYDSAEYAAICARIRRHFPDCAITTDFMVGFPGETDEDFRNSLAFAQRMGFAAMHVFRYSPRAGTRAAAFPEQCSGAKKTVRMEQAQKAAKAAKEAFLKKQIGTEFPVLFERERGDGYHVGHTSNGTVVRISAKNPKKSLRNRIFCVRIEESDAECCYGTRTECSLDEETRL